MTPLTPGLSWLIQLLSSQRLSLDELVRLARLLPRDPKWARRVAPFLPPGLLRGALTAYGNPGKMAAVLALAGGVTLLDSLNTRRGPHSHSGK